MKNVLIVLFQWKYLSKKNGFSVPFLETNLRDGDDDDDMERGEYPWTISGAYFIFSDP